jgi:hypothetical protein
MHRENPCRIRRVRWFAAGTAVIATAAVAIPSASALKVAKKEVTVDAQSFATAPAQCSGGRTAVSGGFAAPGFDPSTGPTVARLGFKHPGKGMISTRAFNFGGDPGSIVSYAYCALHDHDFRIRSATVQVQPQTVGSATAECPRGTQAVAGGFDTDATPGPDGPGVITVTSMRVGERRWKVAGVNIPPDSGQPTASSLTSYAYCEAAPFKLTAVSKDVTVNGLKTFEVGCPNHGRAFSGGFDGHLELSQTDATGTAAITSRRVSKGHAWRSSALSPFGNGPATATAYAYCRA